MISSSLMYSNVGKNNNNNKKRNGESRCRKTEIRKKSLYKT